MYSFIVVALYPYHSGRVSGNVVHCLGCRFGKCIVPLSIFVIGIVICCNRCSTRVIPFTRPDDSRQRRSAYLIVKAKTDLFIESKVVIKGTRHGHTWGGIRNPSQE